MADMKSKHGFGSKAMLAAAIADGKLDNYDIVFLNEGEIAWIDRDGNVVYAFEVKHAEMLESAATDAAAKVEEAKVAITTDYTTAIDTKVGDIGEFTDVVSFVNDKVAAGGGDISGKLDEAIAEANAYTDAALTVVEF